MLAVAWTGRLLHQDRDHPAYVVEVRRVEMPQPVPKARRGEMRVKDCSRTAQQGRHCRECLRIGMEEGKAGIEAVFRTRAPQLATAFTEPPEIVVRQQRAF